MNTATAVHEPVVLEGLASEWPVAACRLLESAPAVVRVTVVRLDGSGPRESGSSMLLTHERQFGSIGGGQLEWRALQTGRALLNEQATSSTITLRQYVLGPDLAQCCGGRVELWFERLVATDQPVLQAVSGKLEQGAPVTMVTSMRHGRVVRHLAATGSTAHSGTRCRVHDDGSLSLTECWSPSRPALWLFGAGHVGQALLRLLDDLPLFRVHAVDQRAELLEGLSPRAARLVHTSAPVECVAAASPDDWFLVMTHDHGLDYELCRAALARDDFAWLGLIGSASKRARFRSRLARDGIAPESIARLNCPIGIGGITSKLPQAIALSVAAQLMQLHEAAAARTVSVRNVVPAQPADCGQDCGACGKTVAREQVPA